ncbi:uncharacterized protein LOC121377063 [Gigantopelta aegis]|uniref:uncharacterized protein LOC121377063 n=1 Tax=Gigantopelta aegis TaxID=1735272 RepID=UPI001B88D888|nr:uncharacterized protein LOC121377063 [Gigantopelta aegis]
MARIGLLSCIFYILLPRIICQVAVHDWGVLYNFDGQTGLVRCGFPSNTRGEDYYKEGGNTIWINEEFPLVTGNLLQVQYYIHDTMTSDYTGTIFILEKVGTTLHTLQFKQHITFSRDQGVHLVNITGQPGVKAGWLLGWRFLESVGPISYNVSSEEQKGTRVFQIPFGTQFVVGQNYTITSFIKTYYFKIEAIIGVSLVGATGHTGLQGVAGMTGQTGIPGQTGLAGALGITGLSGTNGQDGLPGITGTSGRTGVAGAAGVTGIAGQTGAAGSHGLPGILDRLGVWGVLELQVNLGRQGQLEQQE